MKSSTIWSIAIIAIFAALSFASCSKDDDNETIDYSQLGGKWQLIHPEGIADAGLVTYTFSPQTTGHGTVEIFTSDWAAGDHTTNYSYSIDQSGNLKIYYQTADIYDNGEITRLNTNNMTWVFLTTDGTVHHVSNFKKLQ